MYIIPLTAIVESLQIQHTHVSEISGKAELYKLRDEYIPIVRLHEAFNVCPEFNKLTEGASCCC